MAEGRHTLVMELIALHPREYALVNSRVLALSAVITSALVAHCVTLLNDSSVEPATPATPWLRAACMVRVLAALPRPFAWYRIYVLHAAALKQPEVLRVAHRCLAALEDPFVRLNNRLRTAYVTWLVAMLIWLLYCCMPHGVLPWLASAPERKFSPFEKRLQWHVLCCLAAMLLTNLGSAALMLLLISHGDHERVEASQRLDKAAPAQEVSRGMEARLSEDPCIICFGDLAERVPEQRARS